MKDLKAYRGWALVTGASMGLGKAFAERIAREGVNCVLVALEEDLLESLAKELAAHHGVQCRTLAVDLAGDEAVGRIAALTEDIPIGILVNNAGIGCGGDFATRDPARLASLVKLNCLAPVELTRAYLPRMLERGRGAVIMVSSLMGFLSAPQEAAYCASKAFGLHFGEALWGGLRGTGIDVLTVCPAGMKTDFFAADGIKGKELDRLLRFSDSPERIAALALRKLGRKPTVTVPFTWLSSFLARLVPRRFAIGLVRRILDRVAHYD